MIITHSSKDLYKKSDFLIALADTAKELADAISDLADAKEAVERYEVIFAKDVANNDVNEAVESSVRLENYKSDYRKASAKCEVLEARLRNFKDDAQCLEPSLIKNI